MKNQQLINFYTYQDNLIYTNFANIKTLMSDNLSKYQDAFIEAFELEDKDQLSELKYQSIDEWDSIGHMALMAELESNFEITIKTEDLIVFESYKQGIEILARYDIIVQLPD